MLLLFVTISCNDNAVRTAPNNDVPEAYSSMEDGLITLESGVVVKKVGDTFYWQGDIMLSEKQLKTLDKHGTLITEGPEEKGSEPIMHPAYNIPIKAVEDTTATPRSFGIYPTSYNMWAMVRFVYADNLTYDRKNIIQQALAHWEANTNVRFYNATGEPTHHPDYGFEYPYIEFINANQNSSQIGRIGGRQTVKIALFQTVDKPIHEIGHAIGLFHEHNRYDRNNYINVNKSNIVDSLEYNFDRQTTNYYSVGSIDFSSVMMYDSDAFAINPSIPTMTRTSDGSTWEGGTVLSGSDKEWANNFYLPYIARSDTYRELDDTVYKPDGTIMTEQERLNLQAQLNNGDPTPPDCCRLENDF